MKPTKTAKPPVSHIVKYPVLHFLCAGCGERERIKDATIGEASIVIGLAGWAYAMMPEKRAQTICYRLACPKCAKASQEAV